MNKRRSYSKKSRKTSKKYKTSKNALKKNIRKSSRNRSYGFPSSKDILGICVLDTESNYNKIYRTILPELKKLNIFNEKDTLNFCMINEPSIYDENKFPCKINGLYGKKEIDDIVNKKYDIIILDGCPLISSITFFKEKIIKKIEKNLKDDGYLVLSYTSAKLVPEEYMQDKKGKYIGDFFLNIFYKQNFVRSKGDVSIHVYRKRKFMQLEDEYEPGYIEDQYEPGYIEDFQPGFQFFSQ